MDEVALKDGRTLAIRRAGPADAEAMLDYLHAVGGESDNLLFGSEGVPYAVEQEREMLQKLSEAKTSAMFLGILDGRIVSVVNVNAPTRPRIAHTCEIGVSVRKECWNLGVGSAMMDRLVRFARSTGILEVIHLSVRSDNLHAIRLYERTGFVKIGTYEKYMKVDGRSHDVLLMNLYL
ncbi:MAG: GNAT family protein [Candidatus Izemoplasmatales bacterium]